MLYMDSYFSGSSGMQLNAPVPIWQVDFQGIGLEWKGILSAVVFDFAIQLQDVRSFNVRVVHT